MYDLWYLVGTGIMFPKVFTPELITQAKACFLSVKQHIAPVDAAAIGTLPASFTNAAPLTKGVDLDFGGYVSESNISGFRQALADAIKTTASQKSGPPPPISLYSAAKISQWSSISAIDCQTKMADANEAFKDISPKEPDSYSSGFRALVGLLFIDPIVPTIFNDAGQLATADSINAEFNIHSQEKAVIKSFAQRVGPLPAPAMAHLSPKLAPALVDADDADGWQGCSETLAVWENHIAGMLL